MPTQTKKTNGRLNGARPRSIDVDLLHERAGQVTISANGIARIADAVFEGAEIQVRSLDEAVTGVNQMATSLKQTASQADSISVSSDELVSSVNELAVSIEQVTANTASLAASVNEAAAAAQETTASIQSVTSTTHEM